MKLPCGCCEGVAAVTPAAIENRPGLAALAYRVGLHADFFDTMRARLSSAAHAELATLSMRQASDPAIALFDAWACVADVIGFYQERIANEGFLRTATERRSVLELARLVGYRLRPGVASSVYLAYTIEQNAAAAEVPAGARANSIPLPGEQMQVFETSAALTARYQWNVIRPRMSRPQTRAAFKKNGGIYLQGSATGLAPAALLLVHTDAGLVPYRAVDVKADPTTDRTLVTVKTLAGVAPALEELEAEIEALRNTDNFAVDRAAATARRVFALFDSVGALLADREAGTGNLELEVLPRLRSELENAQERGFNHLADWLGNATSVLSERSARLGELAGVRHADRSIAASHAGIGKEFLTTVASSLNVAPTTPPASPRQLERSVGDVFSGDADMYPKLLAALLPRVAPLLYPALRNRMPPATSAPAAFALRRSAPMFGHNAPLKPVTGANGIVTGTEEWPLFGMVRSTLLIEFEANGEVLVSAGAMRGAEKAGAAIVWTRDRSFPAEQSVTIALGTLSSVTVKASYTGDSVAFNTLSADFSDLGRNYGLQPGQLGSRKVMVHGITQELGRDAKLEFKVGNADISVVAHDTVFDTASTSVAFTEAAPAAATKEQRFIVALDAVYEKIVPGSLAVVERAGRAALVATINQVRTVSIADFGIAARVTQLVLNEPWIDQDEDATLAIVRGATVHMVSEAMVLADEPIIDEVCDKRIELDGLYDGLESGRWMIIAGERNFSDTPGVMAAELVMLGGVTAPDPASGDSAHTTIEFALAPAQKLAYCYKRDTVSIYANVVPATHGETRQEVLGAGDAAQPLQRFVLKQPPLTYVSAPTPAGIDSTLEVRVNQLLWHEAASTVGLGPDQRAYVTQTDDDGKTAVIFGNGVAGARLPTGVENVTARYRNGIGKEGNVGAGQISLLASRPLGVKAVVNPLRASGGADRESRDQARANAPLATRALDRLVATRDYADFARLFGGIGKAVAARLPRRSHQVLYLTIAGIDGIPIEPSSALYNNLGVALRQYGDPLLPIEIAPCESLALVIAAGVRVLPDYAWDSVEPAIRARLLESFGFERAGLGVSVVASKVIAAIQAVPGVAYVDLDTLGTVDARLKTVGVDDSETPVPGNAVVLGARDENGVLKPAQLAYLHPQVPDTLILNEIPS